MPAELHKVPRHATTAVAFEPKNAPDRMPTSVTTAGVLIKDFKRSAPGSNGGSSEPATAGDVRRRTT